MALELGESEHAIRVSPADTQSHLHHQCHRVAEQCHSQSDQTTQGIPDGRLGQKGALPGHPGSIEKVEHANSRLETSAESIYDLVRGPPRPIHLTRGRYTEKFTASGLHFARLESFCLIGLAESELNIPYVTELTFKTERSSGIGALSWPLTLTPDSKPCN